MSVPVERDWRTFFCYGHRSLTLLSCVGCRVSLAIYSKKKCCVIVVLLRVAIFLVNELGQLIPDGMHFLFLLKSCFCLKVHSLLVVIEVVWQLHLIIICIQWVLFRFLSGQEVVSEWFVYNFAFCFLMVGTLLFLFSWGQYALWHTLAGSLRIFGFCSKKLMDSGFPIHYSCRVNSWLYLS